MAIRGVALDLNLDLETKTKPDALPQIDGGASARHASDAMYQRNQPLDGRILQESDPKGEFIDLDLLLAAARRRARLVAIAAVLGLACGVIYLAVTPPVYTAATRVLIDEQLAKFTEDRSPAASNAQADSMILSEVEILKSAELARSVAAKLDLQDNEAFLDPPQNPVAWLKSAVKSTLRLVTPGAASSSAAPSDDAKLGKAAALLQQNMSAERVGRSFVVDVKYRSHDPALAGTITRAYADAYLADQLEANFDATQRAVVWLQDRLEELKQSSQQAALDVERFRAENDLTATRGELVSDQELSDLSRQLVLARAETAKARARYEQFQSIVDDGSEAAVRNAAIPPDQPNSGLLNEMKSRFLTLSNRARDVEARFGEDHPQAIDLRKQARELEQQIFGEFEQLTETYRNEFDVARANEQSLEDGVGALSDESSDNGQARVKLRELEQRSEALSNLYQSYLARYEEASQQRSLPIAKARVISRADNPVGASSPNKTMVLAFSLVLGVLAGGGLGAVREFQDRFFRTADDVKNAIGMRFLGYLPLLELPSLGPQTAAVKDARKAIITRPIMRVARDEPHSMFAETIRNARLTIDRLSPGPDAKVIGIVSVLPGEGKSTVASNFACLLAASGAKTLLIDGDLRNRGLTRGLTGISGNGLVEAAAGNERLSDFVHIDRGTGVAVLPASGRLGNTSEWLTGPGMRKLMAEAREIFTYIIVDLPPIGPVIDAKAFEPMTDAFVLVAKWGSTPRALLRSTLQAERAIASKSAGVVLNQVDMKELPTYAAPGAAEGYLAQYGSYYREGKS